MPPTIHALVAMGGVLAKGAAHAEARGIDPATLLAARLAPDMHPLLKQVQLATDTARIGLAKLAQVEPTAIADTERDFADLQDRIEQSLGTVAHLPPDAINGAENRTVVMTVNGEPLRLDGLAYLFGFILPNLFFHTTTAYDILRQAGVPLGKRDFLGALD